MKPSSTILIAAMAIATSPLLMAAQAPPAPQGPPPGGPTWDRQGPGFGGGPRWRRGRSHGFGPGMWGRRGMGMMGGRHGRGMRGQRGAGLGRILRNPAMRERLGVTPEQAARIQGQESAFAKGRIQSDANLRVKRMEMDELLAAEKPDRAAIDKKMRELSDARFAAEKAGMDHRLAMRDALTPEQKEKMKQWQQEQRQRMMERGREGGFGPGARMRGPRPPQAPQAPAPPVD